MLRSLRGVFGVRGFCTVVASLLGLAAFSGEAIADHDYNNIASISPSSGSTAGGTTVTITFQNTGDPAPCVLDSGNPLVTVNVTFGGVAGTNQNVTNMANGNHNFTVRTPAHAAGSVDVQTTIVCTNGNHASATVTNGYTYTAGGGGSGSTPSDSQNLSALQAAVSTLVANTSGAAISNAIDQGIADGFSNGGSLPSFGSSGGFIGFTDDYSNAGTNGQAKNYPPEFGNVSTSSAAFPNGLNGGGFGFPAAPQQGDQRFDEAFSALAYNGLPTKSPPRKPVVERDWNAWADVRDTGFNANDTTGTGNNTSGNQINVTAGLGRKLDTETIVGVVTGYENFNYNVASLGGNLKGNGETIGVYGARRFGNLQFDAALAWSNVNYSATAGTATGSFTGSRWLAKTGLTGNYKYGSYIVEPSAKLYVLWENENAWTDSLGTLQAARNFMAGRTALGARVGRSFAASNGWTLTPYGGLYGEWYFSTDNAIPTGIPVANIQNGWSGRATAGISAKTPHGVIVMLGGEYGGIGADYKIWTGNLRATVPF